MTTSPTPEQSATAILDIFKSQNCIAGDPLKISDVKAQFLEKHGSVALYDAGLMYAEDNGWLQVSPARDMSTNRRWICKNKANYSAAWRQEQPNHLHSVKPSADIRMRS